MLCNIVLAFIFGINIKFNHKVKMLSRTCLLAIQHEKIHHLLSLYEYQNFHILIKLKIFNSSLVVVVAAVFL